MALSTLASMARAQRPAVATPAARTGTSSRRAAPEDRRSLLGRRVVRLPSASTTSSAGISSRNRLGGLYCVAAEEGAAPGVGEVEPLPGPGDARRRRGDAPPRAGRARRASAGGGRRRPPCPIRNTTGNSRPLAECSVISTTDDSSSSSSSVSDTRLTCSRNSSIVVELPGRRRPARRGSRGDPRPRWSARPRARRGSRCVEHGLEQRGRARRRRGRRARRAARGTSRCP